MKAPHARKCANGSQPTEAGTGKSDLIGDLGCDPYNDP